MQRVSRVDVAVAAAVAFPTVMDAWVERARHPAVRRAHVRHRRRLDRRTAGAPVVARGGGRRVLLRHSAGAIAAIVGVVLLPSLLAPVVGDLQRWIAGASPTSALEKMIQTSDAAPEVVGSLGAWPSLAVVVAYAVAGMAAAAGVLVRHARARHA